MILVTDLQRNHPSSRWILPKLTIDPSSESKDHPPVSQEYPTSILSNIQHRCHVHKTSKSGSSVCYHWRDRPSSNSCGTRARYERETRRETVNQEEIHDASVTIPFFSNSLHTAVLLSPKTRPRTDSESKGLSSG